MQPEVLFAADLCDLRQLVDCTRTRSSGVRHHTEGNQSGCAVSFNRRAQACERNAEILIRGQPANLVSLKADNLYGAINRRVRLIREIDDRALHVIVQPSMARHGECRQIRHGAAAHKQTFRAVRKSAEFTQPFERD